MRSIVGPLFLFSDRINRKQFWLFVLGYIIYSIATLAAAGAVFQHFPTLQTASIRNVALLLQTPAVIAGLSIIVCRMRDRNWTLRWIAIALVLLALAFSAWLFSGEAFQELVLYKVWSTALGHPSLNMLLILIPAASAGGLLLEAGIGKSATQFNLRPAGAHVVIYSLWGLLALSSVVLTERLQSVSWDGQFRIAQATCNRNAHYGNWLLAPSKIDPKRLAAAPQRQKSGGNPPKTFTHGGSYMELWLIQKGDASERGEIPALVLVIEDLNYAGTPLQTKPMVGVSAGNYRENSPSLRAIGNAKYTGYVFEFNGAEFDDFLLGKGLVGAERFLYLWQRENPGDSGFWMIANVDADVSGLREIVPHLKACDAGP